MKLLVILLSVGSFLLYQGESGVEADGVSVTEGDSVTLHIGVVKTEQDKIKWYHNNTLIAQINGDQSKICTDVQCNNDTERFRDRLKLDHQTGSLNITNTRNTDSGEYKLLINHIKHIFSVSVHGVSAAERDEVKRKTVMEGESVTFDPGEIKNLNDVMIWYHNNTPIAEITGDQSTDVQCKERFRDRLELNQTGSLTITNITITDSGEYRLSKHITISISSSRRNRRSINNNAKRFEVIVVGSGPSSSDPGSGPSSSDPGSGLPPAAVAGIVGGVVGVLLVAAVAAFVINNRFRKEGMTFKAVRAEEQP